MIGWLIFTGYILIGLGAGYVCRCYLNDIDEEVIAVLCALFWPVALLGVLGWCLLKVTVFAPTPKERAAKKQLQDNISRYDSLKPVWDDEEMRSMMSFEDKAWYMENRSSRSYWQRKLDD